MRPVDNLHYSGSCKVKPLFRVDAARHESITAELRPRPAKLKPMPIGRLDAGVPDSIRYYLARSMRVAVQPEAGFSARAILRHRTCAGSKAAFRHADFRRSARA